MHDDLGWKNQTAWYILPRHWLYEWFSQFHRCGTYSILSWNTSNVKSFAARITLHFHSHFSSCTWVRWYQNVYILDFIGDNDDWDGGDNWWYKTSKATAKINRRHNKLTPNFLQAVCPSSRPKTSVKTLNKQQRDKEITIAMIGWGWSRILWE